jgi:GT2 family glycosyltransferase
MKLISVIIVSWNARGYLRGCLESLRAHGSALIHEIIVVDNSSTDGSPEMVESEFKEVTLIRAGGNLGFARANNLGIARATGEVLALINSDVVLHEGCFEQLTAILVSRPEVGLVGPKVIGGDGKLQPSCRRLPSVWNIFCRVLALDAAFPKSSLFAGRDRPDLDPDKLAEVEVLSGCFWVARRTAVAKVGGLDERFFFYAEDVDWCKRFREAGWTVLYVPAGRATHFGGGSSSNAPLRYSIEILRANLLYWRKHHGVIGWAAYYFLSFTHHFLRFVPRGIKRLLRGRTEEELNHKFAEDYTCLRWLLTGRGV